MNKKLTYIFWTEGKFVVGLCLELDVSSFGKTEKEAQKMLNEAVELTLEDVKKEDYRFPVIKNPKLVKHPISFTHA